MSWKLYHGGGLHGYGACLPGGKVLDIAEVPRLWGLLKVTAQAPRQLMRYVQGLQSVS